MQNNKNFTKNGLKLEKPIARNMFFGTLVLSLGIFGAISLQNDYSDSHAVEANTTFEVNVVDSLKVSITTPTTWATGDVDTFLRNTVSLSVTSNNNSGFTASMYSDGSTDLTNIYKQSVTLPTLASSSTRSAFPSNRWGYSLKNGSYNSNTYGETDAGNASSNYYPLVATAASPITVLQAASGTSSASQDIYFGAKANSAQAAGTYTGTVLISVVTGTVSVPDNPITPSNPATNNDTTENTATWIPDSATPSNHSLGRTVYYTTSSSVSDNTTTTTTDVNTGDVRSSYSNVQGVVTRTESNINNSSIALGLATTASVAAASGIFFFILAKRREEDEDDEEENQ